MSNIDRTENAKDTINLINSVHIKNGKSSNFSVTQIPWYSFSKEPFKLKVTKKEKKIPQRVDKIHPVLKKMLRKKTGKLEKQQVIISFRENLTFLPSFPHLDLRESVNSRGNRSMLRASKNLVQEIRGKREDTYKKLQERYLQGRDVHVLRTYWLSNALLVELSLDKVKTLAKSDEVIYIEPRFAGDVPPSDGNALNDLFESRTFMNSDNYFNIGLNGATIGLLDTGIRSSHTLFNAQSNLGFLGDCVNGGVDCNTGV